MEWRQIGLEPGLESNTIYTCLLLDGDVIMDKYEARGIRIGGLKGGTGCTLAQCTDSHEPEE